MNTDLLKNEFNKSKIVMEIINSEPTNGKRILKLKQTLESMIEFRFEEHDLILTVQAKIGEITSKKSKEAELQLLCLGLEVIKPIQWKLMNFPKTKDEDLTEIFNLASGIYEAEQLEEEFNSGRFSEYLKIGNLLKSN